MQTLFWLLLAGFAVLVAATVIGSRFVVGRRDRTLDEAAVMAYRIEHDLPLGDEEEASAVAVDDLDARWAAFWREADLAYRASDLWAQLHDDADAWVREHPGWNTDDEDVWAARLAEHGVTLATAAETARLDKIESTASQRFARAVDRGVRRFGYAGVVDMFAQWIYVRRRSVKRMVAVLDKAKGWPPEWQRQLDVLLAENAVGRAERDVRARRARGEVWAR